MQNMNGQTAQMGFATAQDKDPSKTPFPEKIQTDDDEEQIQKGVDEETIMNRNDLNLLQKLIDLFRVNRTAIETFFKHQRDETNYHKKRKHLRMALASVSSTRSKTMRAHLKTQRKRRTLLTQSFKDGLNANTPETGDLRYANAVTTSRVAHMRVLLARTADVLMYDVPQEAQENTQTRISILHQMHPVLVASQKNIVDFLRYLVMIAIEVVTEVKDTLKAVQEQPATITELGVLLADLDASALLLSIKLNGEATIDLDVKPTSKYVDFLIETLGLKKLAFSPLEVLRRILKLFARNKTSNTSEDDPTAAGGTGETGETEETGEATPATENHLNKQAESVPKDKKDSVFVTIARVFSTLRINLLNLPSAILKFLFGLSKPQLFSLGKDKNPADIQEAEGGAENGAQEIAKRDSTTKKAWLQIIRDFFNNIATYVSQMLRRKENAQDEQKQTSLTSEPKDQDEQSIFPITDY